MPMARQASISAAIACMIGPVEARDAARPLGLVDPRIAGHDGAVRDPHDEGRVIGAAIGIDEQAREAVMRRRTAERLREAARDRLDPDVIGDMALELAPAAGRACHIRAGSALLA